MGLKTSALFDVPLKYNYKAVLYLEVDTTAQVHQVTCDRNTSGVFHYLYKFNSVVGDVHAPMVVFYLPPSSVVVDHPKLNIESIYNEVLPMFKSGYLYSFVMLLECTCIFFIIYLVVNLVCATFILTKFTVRIVVPPSFTELSHTPSCMSCHERKTMIILMMIILVI
jgi:hypothetical protein